MSSGAQGVSRQYVGFVSWIAHRSPSSCGQGNNSGPRISKIGTPLTDAARDVGAPNRTRPYASSAIGTNSDTQFVACRQQSPH